MRYVVLATIAGDTEGIEFETIEAAAQYASDFAKSALSGNPNCAEDFSLDFAIEP